MSELPAVFITEGVTVADDYVGSMAPAEMCIRDRRNADADLACEVLNEEFAKEIEMGEISPIQAEKNLATVAIVGAVSYTHLDVYKRQLSRCLPLRQVRCRLPGGRRYRSKFYIYS